MPARWLRRSKLVRFIKVRIFLPFAKTHYPTEALGYLSKGAMW